MKLFTIVTILILSLVLLADHALGRNRKMMHQNPASIKPFLEKIIFPLLKKNTGKQYTIDQIKSVWRERLEGADFLRAPIVARAETNLIIQYSRGGRGGHYGREFADNEVQQ